MVSLYLSPYTQIILHVPTIAQKIVLKAELVFYFPPPLSSKSTPALASCPEGCQELSRLRVRTRSPVAFGVGGNRLRREGYLPPARISKTRLMLPSGLAHTTTCALEKKRLAAGMTEAGILRGGGSLGLEQTRGCSNE